MVLTLSFIPSLFAVGIFCYGVGFVILQMRWREQGGKDFLASCHFPLPIMRPLSSGKGKATQQQNTERAVWAVATHFHCTAVLHLFITSPLILCHHTAPAQQTSCRIYATEHSSIVFALGKGKQKCLEMASSDRIVEFDTDR